MNKQDDFNSEEIAQEIDELQRTRAEPDLTFNVPLKIPPKYGVYLWWPAPVEQWVHPEDYATANALIPSNRIFRREDKGNYSLLTYGEHTIRVMPAIWLEVKTEGYEIGDQVEVRSRLGKSRPFIATIEEIRWNNEDRQTIYILAQNATRLRREYVSSEFQIAHEIDTHLDERKRQLMAKARFS